MSAIRSISTAVTTLRENPIILVGGLLFVIVGELSLLPLFSGPVVTVGLFLIQIFVLWPFIIAGFIGMVNAAIDDSTNVGQLLQSGRSNYVPMLGATVLFTILMMVLGIVTAVATIIGAVGTDTSIISGAALFVGFLFIVLISIVFHFYDTAIVVSDTNTLGAFSHSASLVRRNFLNVIGYIVLFSLISFIPRVPDMGLFFLAVELPNPEAGQTSYVIASEPLFALSVVLAVTLGTVTTALAWAYHVAYYRSIHSDDVHTATTS